MPKAIARLRPCTYGRLETDNDRDSSANSSILRWDVCFELWETLCANSSAGRGGRTRQPRDSRQVGICGGRKPSGRPLSQAWRVPLCFGGERRANQSSAERHSWREARSRGSTKVKRAVAAPPFEAGTQRPKHDGNPVDPAG